MDQNLMKTHVKSPAFSRKRSQMKIKRKKQYVHIVHIVNILQNYVYVFCNDINVKTSFTMDRHMHTNV